MRNALLLMPLAWVAGTALQLQQAALWPASGYLLVAWLGLACSRKAAWWWAAIVLLAFAVTGARAVWFASSALDPSLEGRDIVVQGVVAGLPQRNDTGLRFRLELDTEGLPPRIDVGWYSADSEPPPIRSGERWRMTVRPKAPHGARNPHGFDYELWLREQGVQASAYVRQGRDDAPPKRLEQTWRHPLDWSRQQLRDRILASVQPRQTAGLIAALVVGDQNAIERADWDVFRATGVAHLVSISGLHITMFAWGAAWCVGLLWRRSTRLCLLWPAPDAGLLGGLLLACAYALFSGWGVPAQRTCLMLAAVTLLRLGGLRWPWPLVWAWACAIVVLADPWALLQAGFWLSFVAVGVLFATEQPGNGRLVRMLREQWVVTIALAPLSLLLFGQLSLVGLLANAVAIPWVTLVITPLAMLGTFFAPLWDAAGWAIAGWMQLLQSLAAWPLATVSLPAPPLALAALALLGALLLAAPAPWHLRGIGLALALPMLLWQAPRPPQAGFELLAADVGQGNAVLVRTQNHALLYDTGPRYSVDSDAGHRVLVPLLQALQTRLDRVIVSHRDSDHAGGAAAVLAMQPQAALLSSLEEGHPLGPGTRCVAGQRWTWDGVDFQILHPQAEDYLQPRKPNALSCVLRISNGDQTALLVGDIEQPQEARLVAQADLHAQLLLVPHHGSKTSSSAAFLDAVQPHWAIVQAGYRNRFGHPAAPVLQRYAERGIRVLDTPHCGAMTWRSWQPDAPNCQRALDLRYWNHLVP